VAKRTIPIVAGIVVADLKPHAIEVPYDDPSRKLILVGRDLISSQFDQFAAEANSKDGR
jgi:hypothetical protein